MTPPTPDAAAARLRTWLDAGGVLPGEIADDVEELALQLADDLHAARAALGGSAEADEPERVDESTIGSETGDCCPMMRDQSTLDCDQHHEHPMDCPDVLVLHGPEGPGLPIRDGGSSWVAIRYCPWCATDLCAAEADGSERDADGVHRDDVHPDITRALLRMEGAAVPASVASGDDTQPAPDLRTSCGCLIREVVKPARLRALAEAGAPARSLNLPDDHTVTQHWDAMGGDVLERTCSCGESWTHDEDRCPEDDRMTYERISDAPELLDEIADDITEGHAYAASILREIGTDISVRLGQQARAGAAAKEPTDA